MYLPSCPQMGEGLSTWPSLFPPSVHISRKLESDTELGPKFRHFHVECAHPKQQVFKSFLIITFQDKSLR